VQVEFTAIGGSLLCYTPSLSKTGLSAFGRSGIRW
jgi:hypothetical protein